MNVFPGFSGCLYQVGYNKLHSVLLPEVLLVLGTYLNINSSI